MRLLDRHHIDIAVVMTVTMSLGGNNSTESYTRF
jgi:hypothetical protein